MQLTVVIPTYNEAENLPSLVSALFSLPLDPLQVLVVDDNSPDGTGRLADELAAANPGRLSVLHRPGKQGLGRAYIAGFQRALQDGAENIAQMDADFSHPPEVLVTMLETLKTYDVALGSRYVPGGGVDRNWPVWRKWLSAYGNFYARAILRMPVRDVTGGFRAWRSAVLRGLPLAGVRSNGYAFQVEMSYLAYRLGYSYKEIPFYFADRQWGNSKMSFQIQKEAAVRVWRMAYEYRHLTSVS